MEEKLLTVCRAFRITDTFLGYECIQIGNVNKTYKVNFRLPDGSEKSFLVQNVNTFAFRNPVGLMNNIDLITEHIRRKHPGQISLHFHHTEEGNTYLIDGENFWRIMNYIPSQTFNSVQDPDVIREAAAAFGRFQKDLNDFEPGKLCETIPSFHDTRKRYESFDAAIQADVAGRVQETASEINWLQSVRSQACTLTDMAAKGRLPVRVTHNDTKINNVLFDKEEKRALAVIDLDTVMPGVMGHDFGDAIRSAANTAEEDCPDIERIELDLRVFRSFAEGFLAEIRSGLTLEEGQTLALSCIALTAELAVRFLTDYLSGDVYFTVRYPEHNLVRTRAQIALCKDMIRKLPEMEQIIRDCLNQSE